MESSLTVFRDLFRQPIALVVRIEVPHAGWSVGLRPFERLNVSVREKPVGHAVMHALNGSETLLAEIRPLPVVRVHDHVFLCGFKDLSHSEGCPVIP